MDTAVAALAAWSDWHPIAEAPYRAPRTPGVYLVRPTPGRQIVYAGMAGDRHGRGLAGRLRIYTTGKAATSGLGEAEVSGFLDSPASHNRRAHKRFL